VAEASEEGQGPRRAVELMIIMVMLMMMNVWRTSSILQVSPASCYFIPLRRKHALCILFFEYRTKELIIICVVSEHSE
jgi:hypothetical protein